MTAVDPVSEERVPEAPTSGDLAALAADAGPDMHVVADPSGVVRYVSSAARRILGIDPRRHGEAHLLHFLHPQDGQAVLAGIEGVSSRVGVHRPTRIRVRGAGDRWVECEASLKALPGPGGVWVIISAREVAGRQALSERRSDLERLIQFSSVEFARTRWYDVQDVTQHLLRSLCGVFGARVVEIAWAEDGTGFHEAPLVVGASWAAGTRNTSALADLAPVGTLFEPICLGSGDMRSGACSCEDLESAPGYLGAKQYMDAGLDAVLEFRLSPDRPHAVLRMGFDDGLGRWDDINTEPVTLLGLLVLSSLRRCRAEEELHERARRDSLTGLLNRGEFYRLVGAATSSPHQGGRLGVLYCDIDGFKATNDVHGHASGDEVLRAVAYVLTQSVRDGDVVARTGGDEFVALCRGLESPEELDVVAARLAERIADLEVEGRPVGLSVGSAVLQPGQEMEDLIAAADASMYRAKRSLRRRRSDRRPAEDSGQVGDGVVEDPEQGRT